jgi:arylsulfatase A-like enzyme
VTTVLLLLEGVDATYFNSAAGFRGLKMDVYEGGIRIPFIAYWKNKIKPGAVSDLVSGHWDMYNTFAELSGTRAKSHLMEFRSLPELLGKTQRTTRFYLF